MSTLLKQETKPTAYADRYYTAFPAAVDQFDRKIDVDLELKQWVDQYYSCYDSGDFEGMDRLIKETPRLKLALYTSEDHNRLLDAVVAIERYFISNVEDKLLKLSRPMGVWNKNTKYEKYNVVTHTVNYVTQTYVALPPSDTEFDIPIGTLPTDTNYWYCITLRGEKGEPGTGLTPQGTYSLGVQYHTNDLIAHNNCLWYALADNLDQVPNENSSSWQLLMKFTGDLLMFDNASTNLNSTTLEDAVKELNDRTRCIKNITIPAGGFVNNSYTYKNSLISSYYVPQVQFDSASMTLARKSDIEVHTFDGYMTFTAKKRVPAADLKVESILLLAAV